MFIYTIFSWLSLLKRKVYCNVENVVYMKNDEDIPDIHPKIKIEYKIISNTKELVKHSYDKKIKKDIVKFKHFLKHGCKMYLVLCNGDIAGYYHVSKLSDFKAYLYNDCFLFKGGDKYYIFFCHTFDEYRGNGIYSYMLTQICKDTIKKAGNVFISTDMKNIASQKGIEKAGFGKLGMLKYKRVKFFGTEQMFYSMWELQ